MGKINEQVQVLASEILKLFVQRPESQSQLRLGQWFMNAHGLQGYSDLYYEESNVNALSMIRNYGFDTWDLEPLVRYNGLKRGS